MSLTTLGRQLAAINNASNGGGREVGASLPSSKRHEDAIGRGQLHSVQVGHKVSQQQGGTNKSDRYRPSIIYEDARKAADVPLTTIRENCVASLRHLESTVDPEFGPYVGTLCRAGKGNTSSNNIGGNNDSMAGERGLLTQSQNEKLDRKIEDLLFRLALHMTGDDSPSSNRHDGNNHGGTATLLSSCLHVIEFLLRRYDLHIRPMTASAALLAFLPHHEEPFFLRLLQLIDLASLPEWAFLRPYAIPGARLGRSILAQHASKDTSFVRSIAQLSQRNASLLLKLGLRQHQHRQDSKTMAVGLSSSSSSTSSSFYQQKQQQQSLSFTAAVLVEALTLQTRRMGSMDERTCQALLPFVITACRNKPTKAGGKGNGMVFNEVWQNWGHVMASTMVEATVCLASEPRTLMVTSILQGIASSSTQMGKVLSSPMDGPSQDGGVFWNGLIVALTILAQEPPSSSTSGVNNNNNNNNNNNESRLPLLGGTTPGGYFSSTPVREYCGYVMGKEILTALIKLEGTAAGTNNESYGGKTQPRNNDNTNSSNSRCLLARSFGYLYSIEGITDFQHWVASILVVGWKRLVMTYSLMKKRDDNKNKNIRRSKHIFQLIHDLVDEPTLHTLWKERNWEWVESYAAFILIQTPCLGHDDEEVEGIPDEDDNDGNKGPEKPTNKSLSPYRILEAYATSVLKCLRGLDKAAFERGLTSALIQHKKKDQRRALAKWLGLATVPKGAEDEAAVGMDVDENRASESLSLSLPPRVALEHADYRIRLGAIPTLVQEARDEDHVDRMTKIIGSADGGGESTLQALLRRFLHDDNDQVALVAAKGLTDLMDSLRNVKINVDELAEGALEGIATWATRPDIEKDIQSALLCNAFRLASHAAASLRDKSDTEGTLLVRLMEALGAFMCDTDEGVSVEAAKALALVKRAKMSGKISKIGKQAKLLLVSDENVVKKYRRDLRKNDASELFFRRRFFGVLVEAFVASSSSEKSAKRNPHVMREVIDYIIWAVGVFGDSLTDEEVAAIARCLKLTAEFLASEPERVLSIFRDLASCNGKVFIVAVAPFMRLVCANMKDKAGTKVAPMAIVMEIMISCNSTLQVKNLVTLATDMADEHTNGNFYAVAPAMTLASRPDKEIRALAINFLTFLQDYIQNGDRGSLFHYCQYFKDNNSTLLGGTSILSGCLVSVLSSFEAGDSAKKNLMDAALCAAVACGTLESIPTMKFPLHRWLDTDKVSGGYNTALTIFEAAESAGESNFPLLERWALAGKPLLSVFLSQDSATNEDISESYMKLMFAIMRMLKGAKVVDPSLLTGSSSTTIITTGPVSQGGRARSYSFGRSEGVYLNPYPKDMQDAILSVLKPTEAGLTHKMLLESLFETVLSSESWKREVFVLMDGPSRRNIASGVLLNAVESTVENADLIFLSLPLDASDIADLLSIQGRGDRELSMLTYISDFVSSNAARLLSDSHADALFANIFKQVSSLSEHTVDNESIEYARQALLVSLLDLAKSMTSKEAEKFKLGRNRKFESWMVLLVDILGKKDNTKTTKSLSFQNMRTVFTIMAALCKQFPRSVAPNIIPMIKASMSNLSSSGESSALAECLKLALPVYFENVEVALLSVPGLFQSFLQAAGTYDSHRRSQLYNAFVDALGTIDTVRDTSSSPVGTFLAAMIAFETNLAMESNLLKPRMTELLDLVSHIWSEIPETIHIETLWTILSVAKDLLYDIIGEKPMNPLTSFFSASDLSLILTNSSMMSSKGAAQGKGRAKATSVSSTQSIHKEICTLLMVVACDVVATPESRRIICQSEASRQSLILRLWQDLLLLQSSCQNYLRGSPSPDTANFVERIDEVTGQALDTIKDSLPSHMFLAFVSNLIKEGETEELRARAVQLIADRSASMQPVGLEAALFVDMIPDLLALLEKDYTSRMSTDADKVLDQSIFAAIDNIGRNVLSSNDDEKGSPHLGVFFEVVAAANKCIERENCPTNGRSRFVGVSEATRQLVSSSAVCASTAVRVCSVRALPALPGLMKSLLGFLSDATTFLSGTRRGDNANLIELSQAKLMQLAILRTFDSILENLSKFLQPYIGNMLRELSRIRGSLIGDSDNQSLSVRAELERVEVLVTRNIPSRQLMPAAMKAIKTVTDSKSLLNFLPLITESVKHSTSSELSGQSKVVLKIATYIFEHSALSEAQSELIQSSNELLLSLVLKLSEIQLRQLYSKMRDWRGDIQSSDPESSASRRLAFWRLSSSLSEKLRSIFLPCLSQAFPDVVKELDMAVVNLCERHSLKRAGGKKKQKLASDESRGIDPTSIKTLHALLACLNHSLRADARDGGSWTRDTESQRFEKLLTPLGNLLQCQLTTDLSGFSYEKLVQGDGVQSGSVVQCIVALANAAGDEQLWKPLNHAVLQACSNEERPEVRKAGVSCLLSLIDSIGEEYMVLIPECLPVLSELLEDSDEEIAGLAQECISQSEELLGESLEDSLR